jgi:3-phenylpropionate/trans-cinnamate dioxygenase ferredoxin reductase subunit
MAQQPPLGPADSVVVVGAGHAGVQLIDSLRAGGYAGAITLLSREMARPYQRPPLSKDFIAASGAPEALPLRGEGFFDDAGVRALWGVAAERIDPGARQVVADTGERIAYSALVLATGADNRRLGVPGEDLAGVVSLRTLEDAARARAGLEGAGRAVVVGAGFVGLEVAAAARARGVDVTVVAPTERPLRRSVSPAVSAFLAERHALDGVRLELGTAVAGFLPRPAGSGSGDRVASVVTADGRELPADVVVVGVGASPAVGLAAAAGLAVGDGVTVDGALRTSDPHILAIGDCASFPSAHAGRRVRLESVQNATDQARHAAAVLLGAAAGPYAELPWFWSHQGPTKVQIAGLSRSDAHRVVRGDRASGKFSVFAFDVTGAEARLVAVESVNSPADHLAARRLLGAGRQLTPDDAADPAFDLKAYSRAAPVPA